jgi:DNA (cytosine-5)-methyltransferase 1
VPQRRKRIALVADFGGTTAPEILFECKGVSGNSAESGEARKGTAEDAEGSAGRGCLFEPMSLMEENWAKRETKNALRAEASKSSHAVVDVFMGGQGAKAGSIAYSEDASPTLRAMNSGSNQVPDVVCALDCRNMRGYEEIRGTLQAKNEGGFSLNFINPVVYDQQRFGQYGNSNIGSSLKARDYKDATDLIVERRRGFFYIVRRLTPLECCRLQGFPDWWEDGAEGSDSARYKMWGNGIALPCAADVLRRIAKEMHNETTD